MSKYVEYETVMTDPDHLEAALKGMGFTVERHQQAQTLMDFCGNPRPEKAEIIIRRAHTGLGASNDVGFCRVDGKFQAIISEYDRRKFNPSWMGRLAQAYTVQRAVAVAKAKGYIFRTREIVDGKVRLCFQVR